MKVFVDGDVVKYRAAFAAEKTVHSVHYYDTDYDEQVSVACENKKAANALLKSDALAKFQATAEIVSVVNTEPERFALYNVDSILGEIQDTYPGYEMIVCLSGDTNFRNEIGTIRKYKGNRDNAPKPTHGEACVKHMRENYNSIVSFDEEADDVMAYMALAEPEGTAVIATIDKDLQMIPGRHYNFVKKEEIEVNELEARECFWTQMITGDSTDNIVGVPGAGPKRAAEVLIADPPKDWPYAVFSLYVQAYGWAAYPAFIENGRLLWIRQFPEQLWEPDIT